MADNKKKTQDVETQDTSNNEDKKVEGKLFKQEDVDRIVAERLEREEKQTKVKLQELEKQKQAELEKEKKEIQRLAKLSNEEREKELTQKHQKDLKEWESTLAKRENKLEAIDKFSEAGLPIHLVDYVVDESKETTLEKTEKFIENYQKSVESTVAEKLKGKVPKDVNVNSGSSKPRKVQTAF